MFTTIIVNSWGFDNLYFQSELITQNMLLVQSEVSNIFVRSQSS